MSRRIAALAGLLAGCAPLYVWGPTATVAVPAKPPSCGFELIERAPTRPYDELGILAPPDIEDGSMAGGGSMFVDAVRGHVCGAGGDAVVIERDTFGRYTRGTVIRYKPR